MIARLTSAFFVSQLTRRLFADGGFASVLRSGAEAAGAVYVVTRMRDGTIQLYGPASQTHVAEDGERRFMAEQVEDEAALGARMEREARFDPDYWLVEIETATPERYLDIVAV
ncbi:DUF1491 family protein [Aurantimonas sp. MSK8Z-1]|uniref:DUF1491 family protein n=1 Tax=Mangrovibrevibacter kandeliae TaxID=2968473 RepID=UPI002118F53C|nr:DUF1491 family protein [Aurantimonas sp. MSK8Z-1]MCW4113847.1 DUF1491 family protein [Aurantimonas sp. MSK8Z-1]